MSNLVIAFCVQLDGKPYAYHEPTQAPIKPPYQAACELKRSDKLAKPAAAPPPSSSDTQLKSSTYPAVSGAVPQCEYDALSSLAAGDASRQTFGAAGDELLGAVGGVAPGTIEFDESRDMATLCDEDEFVRGISELNVEDE